MATLPSDCRPKGRLIFNMNNHASHARVDVLTNGQIRWVTGGRHHSWISVTGINIHRNNKESTKKPTGLSIVRVAPNQFVKKTRGVHFSGSEVRINQGNYFADTKQTFTRPADMSIQLHQWGGSSECGVVSLFPQRRARHSGYNAGVGWWGRYFGAGKDGSIGRRGRIPGNNANRWNTVRINARADGWVDFYLNGSRRYRIKDNRYKSGVVRVGYGCRRFRFRNLRVTQGSKSRGSTLPRGCPRTVGSGWKLVRHVPAGSRWHPARDQLRGTQVYGNPRHNSRPWSIRFPAFNQFLFATGDCKKWLIADKNSVLGWYSNGRRKILKSSTHRRPYYARWYRRHGNREDPWVSLNDHGPAIPQGNILYGENSFGHTHARAVLPKHGGANVWVRSSTGELQMDIDSHIDNALALDKSLLNQNELAADQMFTADSFAAIADLQEDLVHFS
jgi:hypothetical protein